MEVPNDIKRQFLLTSHPYTSELCSVNTVYKSLCDDNMFLRQLMARWLFPDQTIDRYYPTLTYSQIATYALFYYPIPESFGKFNPTSLYYRAALVYDEQQSRPFFEYAINYNFQLGHIGYDGIKAMLFVADHFGHRNLLRETYDRFILRLLPNDPVEVERKIICMLCALLLENEDKFKLAYRYYLDSQLEQDVINSLSFDLISTITNIYVPGYNIMSLAGLLDNLLIWISDENTNDTNISAKEDFQLGLARTKTDTYSYFNMVSYQLSLCLSDDDLLRFGYNEEVSEDIPPVPKDEIVNLQCLADYWTYDSLQQLEIISVLACRPDLLEEIQLFSIPYINYMQADSYYYYLMYLDFISDSKPNIYGRNHLNVTGYNPDVVAIAKRRGMAPDYFMY